MPHSKIVLTALLALCLLLAVVPVGLGQTAEGEKADPRSAELLSQEEYRDLKARGMLPNARQHEAPGSIDQESLITPEAIERCEGLLVPLDNSFSQWTTRGVEVTLAEIAHSRVDEQTGAVRAYYFVDDASYHGTPEEIARAYLSAKAVDFRLKPDLSDLRTVKIDESPMGYHVVLGQTYHGVPVHRSSMVVTIDRDDVVVFATSAYKPGLSLDSVEPTISDNEACQIALFHLAVEQLFEGFPETELVIWAEGDAARLAYRVTVAAIVPSGSWETIIDAGSGDVLSVADLLEHVDGQGYIFNPDPLTTAQAAYGDTGFVDDSDADSDELTDQRVLVTLRDLNPPVGGVYKLEGPHCILEDWHLPTAAPATATAPDGFKYTRSQSYFEDVCVYYHVDQVHRYVSSLGFTVTDLATNADPHGETSDNSYYDVAANKLRFGEGGVDDPEDADVIWHEMGHAIQHKQRPGVFVTPVAATELKAMKEGFCDYWAGSYSKSLSVFHSDWVYNWDGHNPFFDGRILNDPATYPPPDWQHPYTRCQIWSAVLMQIWDDVHREVADKCVLQSHYLLADNPTMLDNAAAIVQADRTLYGGAHVQQMCARFVDRGCLRLLDPMDENFAVAPMTGGTAPFYRNDDSSTAAIPLQFPFCFYETVYNHVYINNNGNLSFETPYWEYTPVDFPAAGYAMLAPYWADVDTRHNSSGVVFYKSEPHRFTVIWDRVGYFDSHADKLQTFEAIITDGADSLVGLGNTVAFSYADMQWTTGDLSGGSGGFGGSPATVGNNKGDGVRGAHFGRFDHAGTDFDGPGGNPDGVSYLDMRVYRFDACQGATPVEGSFVASLSSSGTVTVRWVIASLTDMEELRVYRATSPDGPFVRINEEPLAPSSSGEFEDETVWPETTFWYELRAVSAAGVEEAVGASKASVTTGGRLALRLHPLAPNPFRGSTAVVFDVPSHAGPVRLGIYNAAGRLVKTLVEGGVERGRHSVPWDGTDNSGRATSTGVYFVRLDVDGRQMTRKVILVR